MATGPAVPVTPAALLRIEELGTALRNLGLAGQGRVRDQGRDLTRVQVDPPSFDLVMTPRWEIVAALKEAGFVFLTLDLTGIPARQPQPDTSATTVTPAAR